MAFSIEQQPSADVLHSTQQPIIVRLKDTAYADPKYRYVCEVTINGAVRAVIKIPPNAANTATFDLSRVCDDFVDYSVDNDTGNLPIHIAGFGGTTASPKWAIFSQNTSPIRKVSVRVGFSKAASATAAPTITYDSTINFLAGIFPGEKKDMFASTETYLRNLEISNWEPDSVTKSALTEAPYVEDLVSGDTNGTRYYLNYVTLNDYACLCTWYAANSSGDRDLGADIDSFRVRIKKKDSGTPVTSTLNIETPLGTAATAVNTDEKMWVNIGVGPKNFTGVLATSTIRTELLADNVEWYEIQLMNSTAEKSGRHRYYVVSDDCYNGAPVRLGWVNRAGGWDYYNFTKKRVKTIDVEKGNFDKDSGNWNADAAFVRSGYEGGRTTHYSDTREVTEISTDWINERDNVLIESLISSPIVHRIDNDEDLTLALRMQNVQIRETSYVEKTSRNDKLIRYTFTIESSKKNVVR